MAIPQEAICPKCQSENTVMVESSLEFINQTPVDITSYACLDCNHLWKITKEVQ